MSQRRLMLRLADADDQFEAEDGVGLPIERIPSELLLAAGPLCALRLVHEYRGWQGRIWLRLTEAGRLIEHGRALD